MQGRFVYSAFMSSIPHFPWLAPPVWNNCCLEDFAIIKFPLRNPGTMKFPIASLMTAIVSFSLPRVHCQDAIMWTCSGWWNGVLCWWTVPMMCGARLTYGSLPSLWGTPGLYPCSASCTRSTCPSTARPLWAMPGPMLSLACCTSYPSLTLREWPTAPVVHSCAAQGGILSFKLQANPSMLTWIACC